MERIVDRSTCSAHDCICRPIAGDLDNADEMGYSDHGDYLSAQLPPTLDRQTSYSSSRVPAPLDRQAPYANSRMPTPLDRQASYVNSRMPLRLVDKHLMRQHPCLPWIDRLHTRPHRIPSTDKHLMQQRRPPSTDKPHTHLGQCHREASPPAPDKWASHTTTETRIWVIASSVTVPWRRSSSGRRDATRSMSSRSG